MKKWYLFFLLMVSFLGTAGCSDDLFLSDNKLYVEDGVCEVWTGNGLPTWLDDRLFKFELETGWGYESYWYGVLWKAYKFKHSGTLMIALEYEKVGYEYNWKEGTICYSADGREVNFSKAENSFKKGAELIWTNEICTEESVPQLSYCNFENPESLGWFQEAIDASCREVREAGNFMLRFYFGRCEDEEGNPYLGIQYDYADRTEKKRTTVQKAYTMTGEEMEATSTLFFKGEGKVWGEFISQRYMGE